MFLLLSLGVVVVVFRIDAFFASEMCVCGYTRSAVSVHSMRTQTSGTHRKKKLIMNGV